jgi:hypothetical protein
MLVESSTSLDNRRAQGKPALRYAQSAGPSGGSPAGGKPRIGPVAQSSSDWTRPIRCASQGAWLAPGWLVCGFYLVLVAAFLVTSMLMMRRPLLLLLAGLFGFFLRHESSSHSRLAAKSPALCAEPPAYRANKKCIDHANASSAYTCSIFFCTQLRASSGASATFFNRDWTTCALRRSTASDRKEGRRCT